MMTVMEWLLTPITVDIELKLIVVFLAMICALSLTFLLAKLLSKILPSAE